MANTTSPFRTPEAKLDPFVEGIVGQGSLEQMDPGETTYSSPAVIHVDGSSTVLVDKLFGDRGRAPGSNANLKLVQHVDGGLYVDATALTRVEIETRFAPRNSTAHRGIFGTEPAHFIVAVGVLIHI